MRTFVLRVRKGTSNADKLVSKIGSNEHVEIIAHTLANAFYYSNGMRDDVEVYVVLDSTADFPKTLKFSSNTGLSFPGFHEQAILDVVADALHTGRTIAKDNHRQIAAGIELLGYGFDKLLKLLQESSPIYLLDKKGDDIRTSNLLPNGVFILSDHLPMPKNSIKGLERRGVKKISLGKKMLFASQCVVLIHNEIDRGLM